MPNLAKAALWYAEHGLPVFPLLPRDKRPLTKHGFHDATKDPVIVRSWWKETPQANIGMPMGKPSGRLLLDLDFRNGGPKDRMEVLERYGAIPETAEVITGAGRHIYFRDPGGPVPRQIAKGIELKADGGYSVLPPSVHPNGKRYEFDGLANQETMLHVAAIPAWLTAAIAALGRPLPATSGGRSKTADQAKPEPQEEKWPPGDRNTRLTSLAGRLRRNGLNIEAIEAALLIENRARCIPPLPDTEVRRIAQSVGRYSPAPAARSFSASVSLGHIEPSLDLLNALAVFQGRIRFEHVKRRGPMVIAKLADGSELVWPTTTELAKFGSSQAIISDATNILLPSPPHGRIRTEWEAAAHMLLQLSADDGIALESSLREETRELLRLMWRQSGQASVTDTAGFIRLMRTILTTRRDPRGEAPPCVFIAEESVWVHVPTLRTWLSTPAFMNKLYPLAEIRNGLLLLDFKYFENLSRGSEGDTENACLWRGPLEVLG